MLIINSKKEKVVVLKNPTIKLTFSNLVTAGHINTCCQHAMQSQCTASLVFSLYAWAISPYKKARAFSPMLFSFYPHSELAFEPPPHTPNQPLLWHLLHLWHSLALTHQVAALQVSLPKKEFSVEEKPELAVIQEEETVVEFSSDGAHCESQHSGGWGRGRNRSL